MCIWSYDGCSDGTFEIIEDWLVECALCGQRYNIDRESLHITVEKHGDVYEHYFLSDEFLCKGCGEKLFARVKVYESEQGEFIGEIHEGCDVDFIKEPVIKLLSQPQVIQKKDNSKETLQPIKQTVRPYVIEEVGHMNDPIMVYNLKNEDIAGYNESENYSFPKYTSQLINWANQNAQGTRPRVVGQMSELFPEFVNSTDRVTIEYWKRFYIMQHPEAFQEATDRIYNQIENLRDAIQLIDRDMVERWVEDLVINKTFNGMYVQKAILASLADLKDTDYRLATPEEESKGIDGFVGNTAYSVKPDSYKTMGRLSESISVKMIYYTKTKTGLKIEVEE